MRLFLYLVMIFGGLTLWSCQKTKPPAVIVVAVDDFSVDHVVCNSDQIQSDRSGWVTLCQESIRFTHAYTTSTMSVPALASLVTGQYPFQHGLRMNSKQFLNTEQKTIPELAVEKKWRTSFFSGGAPVFRKTGLNQGFEYFDDIWNMSPGEIYKPLHKSLIDFKEWYKDDIEDSSFLSFFYAPDLAFLNSETKNEFGESRNLSFESQLNELDENLFDLIHFLKKQDRWEETTLIIVGLHGRPEISRAGVIKGNNLHSENTQVGLFIKPRKSKAQSIQWKIDRDVNLADVGQTISELVTGQGGSLQSRDWPIYSLKKSIENLVSDWPAERPLLIESMWESWVRNQPWSQAAVILNHQLYLFDQDIQVFNLLADRLEANSLSSTEYRKERLKKIETSLANLGFQQSSSGKQNDWREQVLQIPYHIWLEKSESRQLMKELVKLQKLQPKNKNLLDLVIRVALENEDWESLFKLSQEAKNDLLTRVAQNQLKKTNAPITNKCFQIASLPSMTRNEIKNCDDPLFSRFLLEKLKTDPMNEFERFFEISVLRNKIRRHDLALQLRFDPQNIESSDLSLFEIFLSLPENQKLRGQLFRRVLHKSQDDI